MSTPSPNWYHALLSCNHTIQFYPPPRPGDEVYCRRCADYRICRDVVKSWRYSCRTKDCTAGNHYGTDVNAAIAAGVRHLRRFPKHNVWLHQAASPVRKIRDSQPELPIVT